MVPTPVTRREEVDRAPVLATDLVAAADLAAELLTGVVV
jgi:hypothetical protein